MNDTDVGLQRQILDGKEYDHLLPKTTCERVGGGVGDTDFSISEIKAMVEDYYSQTEKLAKVLKVGSLERDVPAIKDFLYNHFQYLGDELDQMMRAPSCSWFQRYEGIDCKSYSIFANCLLWSMKYTCIIRKIRQKAPTYLGWSEQKMRDYESGFSHVYVIIPLDQENATLDKGYYVIDGTLQSDREPHYLEAKDLIMKFPHHRLLGAVVHQDGYSYQDLPPLNGGISLSSLKDLSKSFKLNDLKGVWGKISCLGGSSLDANGLKKYLANIDVFYQDWVYRFNSAISSNNFQLVSYLIAEYRGLTAVFHEASRRNKQKGWNGCTGPNIDIATSAFLFYKDVVGAVLTAYVNEYFNQTSGSFPQNAIFSSENAETKYGFRHLNVSPLATSVQPNQLYVPDLRVNIPAFDLPKYVVDQTNAGQPINVDTVLNLLETAGNIVRTVAPGSSGGTVKPTKPGNINITPGLTPINSSKTKTAGLGTFALVVVTIAGIAIATGKMKDQPISTAPKSTTRKTVKK